MLCGVYTFQAKPIESLSLVLLQVPVSVLLLFSVHLNNFKVMSLIPKRGDLSVRVLSQWLEM